MPMYNLIEYSDNYQDSSATLYQYKRDEPQDDLANNLATNTSRSFKYKVNLLGDPNVVGNVARRDVKIVVPLKYLSNFFRSLEMPLPVVTLSKEDKDLRSIYWNEYKTKEQDEFANANVFKYISLDPSLQGVNRLFIMAYDNDNANANRSTRDGRTRYYLPTIDLNKYNVVIDGRNFYDNPIESDIEKYRELCEKRTGKGEDYPTGSLLDYNYFIKHYKLVAVDLSKQKGLDADPRAIQQIEFKYMLGKNSTIYWVLEKSKETIPEFYKGTVKVY